MIAQWRMSKIVCVCVQQATEDMEILQKEISARDAKILAQRQQLSRLEVELAQSNHLKERTETKFSQSDGERQVNTAHTHGREC